MSRRLAPVAILGLALASFAGAALAHHPMDGALPGTFVEGFLSGLGHPLIGIDHAAFILATGFLLARVTGGLWGLGALILGTLAGAALFLGAVTLPAAEIGVALSVVLVGALVLARRRLDLPRFAAGLALAGLLHGQAYAESILGAEATPLAAYLFGFSLIQGLVGATAFAAHRRFIDARWMRAAGAAFGALVGAVGAAFLLLGAAG
ncbi:MAG TPA: HupE/UreJ family protein [Burkholderiales bacterium]